MVTSYNLIESYASLKLVILFVMSDGVYNIWVHRKRQIGYGVMRMEDVCFSY